MSSTDDYCLIIAHDFPPFSGGGVMRIHKFVKYLPETGIIPIVVTINEKYIDSIDKSLIDEYCESVKIYRTATIPIKKIYNLIKRSKNKNLNNIREIYGVDKKSKIAKIIDTLNASIFVPDYKVLWVPFCIRKCSALIKKFSIKTIITTSPPHSVQLAGIYLKKKFPHLNWIVDFRDLWTDYNVYNYPFQYVRKLEEWMEKKTVSNADNILCATESIKRIFLKKYPALSADKFTVITNGYDPDDFNKAHSGNISNKKISKKNKLKILYSGSLNDWRNIENLTNAISMLINNNKIDRKKINIQLRGHITVKDAQMIAEKKLNDIFEIFPMEEHLNSLARLNDADILLLIIGALEGSEVLTGKIFEYIGSQRPIFGIVIQNSEADNLISNNNLGYVCNTDSFENIAEVFLTMYNDFFENTLHFSPNSEVYEKYSRVNLTKKLVGIIK